jgi:CubicO group peptidase (beta-lactamase class C family)
LNICPYLILAICLAGCNGPRERSAKLGPDSDPTPVVLPGSAPISEAEIRKYHKIVQDFYDTTLLPGGFNGAMLVARKGKVVFEKYAGIGYLDAVTDSINPNTSFHIASVSKTFTAMAVLKLWEEGRLDIHRDVSLYLPGFNYPGVTVKTLLNHRSGLPNYVNVMEQKGWDKTDTVSNEDVLQFMIRRKDELMPGSPDRNFSYCNTNYALLALVIERVSGKKYSDYLSSTFFRPLDMEHTFVFEPGRTDPVLPSYDWRGVREPFTYLDHVYGDKNIYSTPRDLLKWDMALGSGKLFRQQTLDSAYTGYSHEKPGVRNYGLGWRLYLYPDHRRIIYHNGWWHGNNAVFTRLLQDSATVIILVNQFNRRIYEARNLYSALGNFEVQAGED